MASQTNSSLSTHRRCPKEYEYRYEHQLERAGDEREVLAVGTTWHLAHDYHAQGLDPYQAIKERAPGENWVEKLSRLFAAYHWYWEKQPLEIVQPEFTFNVTIGDKQYEGQIDGIVKDGDRYGIVERKTTSEDLSTASAYWDRLRMDTQVGLYSVAAQEAYGVEISFIIYDVVRKPTIRPKKIVKKDLERMKEEFETGAGVKYFETFPNHAVSEALEYGVESLGMYGARLTNDIGEQPDKYFARREVPRTKQDIEILIHNLNMQADTIEDMRNTFGFYRVPEACNTFGCCDFFSLCSNNVDYVNGGAIPDQFQVREHRHPELAVRKGGDAK